MNQVEQKKSVPPKKQKPKLREGKVPPSQEIKARAYNRNPTARTQKVTKVMIDDFLSKIDLQELNDREEYKIYKKLKTEVGDFYPYPGLWLEAPHELLSGRTPLEIALTSPQGAEIVFDLIAAIKAGHFS